MRKHHAASGAALVALAVPLLLAACGGEERRAPPPPSPPETTSTVPGRGTPPASLRPPSTTAPTIHRQHAEPRPVETIASTRPRAPTLRRRQPPAQPRPVVPSSDPELRVSTTPLARTGASAPSTRAGVLRFDRIVVVETGGRFGGHANVRNSGPAYLNRLRIRWRLLDARGGILDGGVATWPSLAPGETATVQLRGTQRYRSGWKRIVFELLA